MFPYRDHYYAARAPEPAHRNFKREEDYHAAVAAHMERLRVSLGVAELAVAKNKFGPIGTRKLAWDHDRVWFNDLPDGAP